MVIGRTVYSAAVAAGFVLLGVTIEKELTARSLATVCEEQPGVVLASTIQDKTGVICIYADDGSYGRARWQRRAVKKT